MIVNKLNMGLMRELNNESMNAFSGDRIWGYATKLCTQWQGSKHGIKPAILLCIAE